MLIFFNIFKVLFHTWKRKYLLRKKYTNLNVPGFETGPLWKPSKRSDQLRHGKHIIFHSYTVIVPAFPFTLLI